MKKRQKLLPQVAMNSPAQEMDNCKSESATE